MFEIINKTDLEYENIKITIGGIQDGEFTGIESYTLPTIRIRNNNSERQYIAVDHNRWRPNLHLVKEISDKAYFMAQLEGQTPVLLYDTFENDILVSAPVSCMRCCEAEPALTYSAEKIRYETRQVRLSGGSAGQWAQTVKRSPDEALDSIRPSYYATGCKY